MIEHSFVKFVPGVYVVYLSVPKVASSSISHSLLMEVPSVHKNIWEHSDTGKALTNRRAVTLPYPRLPIFTFVRNPIDKFTSYYRDKFVGGRKDGFELSYLTYLGFDPFMNMDEMVSHMMTIPVIEMEHHAQPQYRILIKHGQLLPDFIGHFERMDESWAQIAQMSLVDLQLGQRRNNTSEKTVEPISAQSMSALCQYYSIDFALFNYPKPNYGEPHISVPEASDALDKNCINDFRQQIENKNKRWKTFTEKLTDSEFKNSYLIKMKDRFNQYLLAEYQNIQKQ